VLLAGRFLVPRASLLALPEGPVVALDLSSGESVSLAYGPVGDGAELARRIERWNALAQAGCPAVRELRWQLGRPLLSSELVWDLPLRPPQAFERELLVAQAVALGAALDAADLGLAEGPADLAVGPAGICLRRPAVWAPDPTLPLARTLAAAASRLLDLRPEPAPARAPTRAWRVRLPATGSRRARVALVATVAAVAAVISSSLVGGSHGDVAAHAAAVRLPAAARQVADLPAVPGRPRVHPTVARPTSRGGPARVLVVARRAQPPAPAYAPRRAARAVPTPSRGWVAGLFVGPEGGP
jgi:hypothetical protein